MICAVYKYTFTFTWAFYSPTGVKKQFIQKHIKYIFPMALLFSLLITKGCMLHKSMKSLEMLLLLSFLNKGLRAS